MTPEQHFSLVVNSERSTQLAMSASTPSTARWGTSLILISRKAAPALALGNTAVLNAAERSPATASLLGRWPPSVVTWRAQRGPSVRTGRGQRVTDAQFVEPHLERGPS
jgi:hypothetical protein